MTQLPGWLLPSAGKAEWRFARERPERIVVAAAEAPPGADRRIAPPIARGDALDVAGRTLDRAAGREPTRCALTGRARAAKDFSPTIAAAAETLAGPVSARVVFVDRR